MTPLISYMSRGTEDLISFKSKLVDISIDR